MFSKRVLTPKEEQAVCEAYISGLSCAKIARSYKCTDKTINLTLKRYSVPARGPRDAGCGAPKQITPATELIVCLRYKNGESAAHIASETQLALGTIYKILTARNIPRRLASGQAASRRKFLKIGDELIQRYNAGESMESMAKEYRVHERTIRKHLVNNGVTIRPSSIQVAKSLKGTHELKILTSARLQGIPVEEWQGFAHVFWDRWIARPEYQQWQRAVTKLNGAKCQMCGKKNHQTRLECHHIYPKTRYFDIALDPHNGIVLCADCHYSIKNRELEMAETFLQMIQSPLKKPILESYPNLSK